MPLIRQPRCKIGTYPPLVHVNMHCRAVDAFSTLQRLLEARQGKAGKREYVQVLRLLEHFELNVLHLAIKDALQMGAISFDAIKHLLLCRVERRQPRLDLDLYPFLPRTNVATTSAASYMSLLSGGGV